MINDFAHPRPEYPRPDRQRGLIEGRDWLNLNGAWQFRFDGERVGIDEKWFSPEAGDWRQQIIVPFCWESLAAWGEGDAAGNENYYSTRVFRNPLEVDNLNHRTAPRYEVGWYKREVVVPNTPEWEGKRVILTVGAADFFSECWCNGTYLGKHEGGYTPFEFDLTDDLTIDRDGVRSALIVMRVEDPMDNHEQPVGKQWNWYTTTSGIWQTVWIEPRHMTHISSFRVLTHIETGQAGWLIQCDKAAPNSVVEIEIIPPLGEPYFKTIPVQDGVAEGFVEATPLLLWDPNTPHLYGAVLRLKSSTRLGRESETFDTVRTYFGMRKIDAAPPDSEDPTAPLALRLNGEPRYLRGALYQSYFPEGVYTAGSAHTLRDDIAYAREAGFNFLRVHIKIDDPLVLYYADTMGMMLMCDFPNFGEGGDTPLGRARFETMMRAAIERDWNHPSIVAWCLFNETWGFGGQVELVKLFPGAKLEDPKSDESSTRNQTPQSAEPQLAPGEDAPKVVVVETTHSEPTKLDNKSSHEWVQSIWELAKSLDSTRLIEDMSVVYWDHLNYYGHGDTDINSWHFYIDDYYKAREHIEKIASDTFKGSTFNQVEGFEQGRQPLINSEYGGVGALDGNRDISWSFKFLTNELRRQGKICAYIYTELHDVEWEYNGFLRYDRSRKEFGYDPTQINAANVLPIDAPPIARHKTGDRVLVPVSSSHYAMRKRENISLRWRMSGMDRLAHIHTDLQAGTVPIPFPHWQAAPAAMIELQMPDTPMLCCLVVEAISRSGEVVANNDISFLVAEDGVYAREEKPDSLILRGAPGDWALSYWPDGEINRDTAHAEDLCWSRGKGFFEWSLPLEGADLHHAKRIRVLVEASSHREDESQTDCSRTPSTLRVLLNDLRVHQATLSNHPHDARGVLSYLRGGKGAYGFMANATIEGALLHHVADAMRDDHLRLRIEVPPDAAHTNGLTIYGAECGRYPLPPTVVIEW